jgi:hypothetical protein
MRNQHAWPSVAHPIALLAVSLAITAAPSLARTLILDGHLTSSLHVKDTAVLELPPDAGGIDELTYHLVPPASVVTITSNKHRAAGIPARLVGDVLRERVLSRLGSSTSKSDQTQRLPTRTGSSGGGHAARLGLPLWTCMWKRLSPTTRTSSTPNTLQASPRISSTQLAG